MLFSTCLCALPAVSDVLVPDWRLKLVAGQVSDLFVVHVKVVGAGAHVTQNSIRQPVILLIHYRICYI